MEEFAVTLEIENLDELKNLVDVIQKNVEELERNIEKINNLKLVIVQKSV